MFGVRRISHLINWLHTSAILDSCHTPPPIHQEILSVYPPICPETDHISLSLFLVQLPSSLTWITAASSLVSLLPPEPCTAARGVLLKQKSGYIPLLLKTLLWFPISHPHWPSRSFMICLPPLSPHLLHSPLTHLASATLAS